MDSNVGEIELSISGQLTLMMKMQNPISKAFSFRNHRGSHDSTLCRNLFQSLSNHWYSLVLLMQSADSPNSFCQFAGRTYARICNSPVTHKKVSFAQLPYKDIVIYEIAHYDGLVDGSFHNIAIQVQISVGSWSIAVLVIWSLMIPHDYRRSIQLIAHMYGCRPCAHVFLQ